MPTEESVLIRFELYRLKFIRPHQQQIASDNLSTTQLLTAAITSRPQSDPQTRSRWHVGNVRSLAEEKALSFAIGRTSNSTIEKFDEEAGDFLEEPTENSPYTFCVVLVDLGVAAIAHKSKLAAKTKGIARRLEELLALTDVVVRNGVSVEVRLIPNPEDFVELLRSAYQVQSFTATFRGPNPIDADEIFQRPLAVIAAETDAEEGQVKLKGVDLDRDAVASITRSTAATGNHASARLKDEQNTRARTVKMEPSPVELVYRESEINIATVAADLRERYQEVRSSE